MWNLSLLLYLFPVPDFVVTHITLQQIIDQITAVQSATTSHTFDASIDSENNYGFAEK